MRWSTPSSRRKRAAVRSCSWGFTQNSWATFRERTPECFHVVTPDPVTPVHTYRVDDFAAYFRLIRNRLETTSLQDHASLAAENYPEPVDHCEICRWQRDL